MFQFLAAAWLPEAEPVPARTDQSRLYRTKRDLDEVFRQRVAAREKVVAAVDPATLRDALRWLFPCPPRCGGPMPCHLSGLPLPPLVSGHPAALCATLNHIAVIYKQAS